MKLFLLIPNAMVHLLIVGLFFFIISNAEVLVIINKYDVWMSVLLAAFVINSAISFILFTWFKQYRI
ncbi:hypothetical protein [Peribacillus sp. SCS-155]|uniref:hypothetical protein n=1 Tax=Peribacillus sedimenti TaxID=3115297 RepID=UPI003906A2A9